MFAFPVASSLHRRALRGAPYAFAHLLADHAFNAAAEEAPRDETRVPRIDVFESDNAYSVVLDMPGAVKEQVKVSVEGRRVVVTTVAAPAPEAVAPKADEAAPTADATRVLYRERSAPVYARTVVLPAEVDQSASQARFENGVLTLTLTKRVPAGATQISIN
jgi:HSP20 family protein